MARFGHFVVRVIGLLSCFATPLDAAPPDPEANGWERISLGAGADSGVDVFRRSYNTVAEQDGPATGKVCDYLTIADLRKCRLVSVRGPAGGTDREGQARIACFTMEKFWNHGLEMNDKTHKLKVALNGTFFDMDPRKLWPHHTFMNLGMKHEGRVLSYGVDVERFKGRALLFRFKKGEVDVVDHSKKNIDDAAWPDVIPVVDPAHPIDSKDSQRRQWLGIRDDDGDGKYETILSYSTEAATQDQARESFAFFKPAKIGMLDGGGSTGLIVDGEERIKPVVLAPFVPRALPHVLLIFGQIED